MQEHKNFNEHFGYTIINGIYKYPDCPHCGDELEYQWAFDELQVTRIIYDMRDKGLL